MTVMPAPMKSFAPFLDAQPGMCGELPLVHTTECDRFGVIAAGDTLAPQHCNVFNEPLTYLFYGRPAYRSRRGIKPSTDIAFCPVCFVFKPYTLTAPVARLFPFDSGASKGGQFVPHVHGADTESYELTAAIESARRVTHFFFESNRRYFVGEPREGLALPDSETHAKKYYELISHTGEEVYDDRRSAIEIQVRDQLILKDTLLAIVLPLAFLQRDDIRKAIVQDWRTYPITYETVRGSAPSEYYAIVRERLKDFLAQGQYL